MSTIVTAFSSFFFFFPFKNFILKSRSSSRKTHPLEENDSVSIEFNLGMLKLHSEAISWPSLDLGCLVELPPQKGVIPNPISAWGREPSVIPSGLT